MPNALNTGVSGLIAHQRMLDVVGNNLANLNTTGFKVQRTIFADLLYETIRPAASASNDRGGINPNQIGSGVKVGQVARKFGQGNLELTGGLFDFAVQGDGMFMLSDGSRAFYTRAGTFALDSNSVLVDPSTGYTVKRFGTVGEPDGVNPGFQTAGDERIVVPFGAIIPGSPTQTIQLPGNLDAEASEPIAAVLTSSLPFMAGGSPATSSTLLDDLDSNQINYALGDNLVITGEDFDGTDISVTMPVDSTTTVGDLLSAINGAFSQATAALDGVGNITLTADDTGPTPLRIALQDDPANTGGTDFAKHGIATTTDGKNADTYTVSTDIYDIQGAAHNVEFRFEKVSDNLWNLVASLDSNDGTIIDGAVKQVQFSEDGSFRQVSGTVIGDAAVVFDFNGFTTPQTIQIQFGNDGPFDGLVQLATGSTAKIAQDGVPPGALASVSISLDGVIEGVATNGRKLSIAQLAIASFINPQGLTATGENYFTQSINSGEPSIGSAQSGNRGSIVGGQLEASNVDIAHEFTRLIVAQRGFSANARTITVADEVLEELTNTIR